jgi:hypothetical protein
MCGGGVHDSDFQSNTALPCALADYLSINWTGDSSAEVHFTRETAFKAASDALGGGVRGVFRIDRSSAARPSGAAPLSAAAVVASRPPPRQEQVSAPSSASAQPKDKEWLVGGGAG